MRKYYIPTTTLNFNNILSSESISPKAFYEQRGFGYSHWWSIPENNLDNVIILYSSPFNFVRPESELEDHPMLIEIESEEIFSFIREGVFYSDHTIYLSYRRASFIFFTEQDKRVTLSRSESSLETKFVDLYEMKVSRFSNLNEISLQLNVKLNKAAIEKDYRINKLKGLLYGYYIGKIYSMPLFQQENHILQELQDIVSIILSSEQHSPAPYQYQRIFTLLKEYQKYTDCGSWLHSLNSNWDDVYNVIEKLLDAGAQIPGVFRASDLFIGNNNLDSEDNPFILWMKKEKEYLKQRYNKVKYELWGLPTDEFCILNLYVLQIGINGLDSKDIELVEVLINDTFLKKEYNGNISSYGAELSDDVTKKAREFWGTSWENSNIRRSLNEMRKYVRMQSNEFEWNDLLTSSIAAVIAHGDDWEKLLRFMDDKKIYDYQLTFAFYGELNGFANLDRNLIEGLYQIADKEYLQEVYEEFYRLLFPAETGEPTEVSSTPLSIEWDNSWQDDIREYIVKTVKRNKKEIIHNFDKAIKQNGSNDDILNFMDLLVEFEYWHTNKGKPTKFWCSLKEYVEQKYDKSKNNV